VQLWVLGQIAAAIARAFEINI